MTKEEEESYVSNIPISVLKAYIWPAVFILACPKVLLTVRLKYICVPIRVTYQIVQAS